MAITSRLDLYAGINAHFQSHAQNTRDGWSSFHSTYITRLNDALTEVLPEDYRAVPEQSLQLRTQDSDRTTTHYPRPDISILNPKHRPSGSPVSDSDTLATPVAELDLDERYKKPTPEPYEPTAVVIKKDDDEVARIELLSPKNKKGEALDEYLDKRAKAIEAGIVVVEVDFLHQTKNLIPDMPNYSSQEIGAYPYIISVMDPAPQQDHPDGKNTVYGFGVDEPLKPIKMPLLGEDSVSVNFGDVYHTNLNRVPFYTDQIDYSQNPLGFEHYTYPDQAKIWARMLAVADIKRTGVKLSELKSLPEPKTDDPALQYVQNMPYKRASLFISEANSDACWLVQHPSSANTKNQELSLVYRTFNTDGDIEFNHLSVTSAKTRAIERTYHDLEETFEKEGFPSLIEHAHQIAMPAQSINPETPDMDF